MAVTNVVSVCAQEPEKNNNNAQPSNPKPPPPKLSKNDDKLSWSSGDEDSTASNSNGDVSFITWIVIILCESNVLKNGLVSAQHFLFFFFLNAFICM